MSGYARGGLWTNTEDEILKVAVAKYGLTQWSRCSSLLNRKTAKQCKARWNNWLSPSIKKSDWTPVEDEKLLLMAKILPNQWYTIAPLVGRTPNQCIERYQRLLNDLQDEDTSSVNPEAQAPVGPKIDLTQDGYSSMPESKPARPDAIEIDEDEQEMISEARARLANTQGKKAKRKQRERMLAQSNRLALLLKRSEARNAGFKLGFSLISKNQKKKNKNLMDYNSEIPFEQKPVAAVYDVAEEEKRDLDEKSKFDRGAHRQDHQNVKSKKRKLGGDKTSKGSIVIVDEAIDEEELVSKRQKLVLPAPNSNDELLQLVAQERSLGIGKLLDDSGFSNSVIESTDQRIKKLGQELHAFQGSSSILLEKDVDGSNEQETVQVKKDMSLKKIGMALKKKFALLPEPKNDFEIALDSSDEEEENVEITDAKLPVLEESEDEPILSEVIQRGLRVPNIESFSHLIEGLVKYPVVENLLVQSLFDEVLAEILKNDNNREPSAKVDKSTAIALINKELAISDSGFLSIIKETVGRNLYDSPGVDHELSKQESLILAKKLVSQIKQTSELAIEMQLALEAT